MDIVSLFHPSSQLRTVESQMEIKPNAKPEVAMRKVLISKNQAPVPERVRRYN